MFFLNKNVVRLCVLFILLFLSAKSQSLFNSDNLKEKIKLYGLKNRSGLLFVHFDKTIYTNNDNVWFTAYIHKTTDITRYTTLALMLVNDEDSSVIIQDKFVIKNGNSFGNAIIPDSARAGNYTFIAYTNNMVDGHIDVVFTQPITIKSADNADVNIIKAAVRQPPAAPVITNIRFYPESGSMVNGLRGAVGWEAKSSTGVPKALTAFLYDGDKVIDTVETDLSGQGKFMLKPAFNHNYYLKLYNGEQTIYRLPVISAQGVAIGVKNAIAEDSLFVEIRNTTHQKLSLVCHNYSNTFFVLPTSAVAESNIALSLHNVPRGLTQLTLLDSVGRPYAERTFFAHYSRKLVPLITTDNSVYAKRQKVNIKIRLAGRSDTGMVSIACVEEKRIEPKKQRKIDDYVYLQNDLVNAAIDPGSLETQLMIKGWKRFTWADVLQAIAADTAHIYDHIEFKGKVYRNDTELKQPVTVINPNKPLSRFTTFANGVFSLNDSDLISPPGKKINFIVDQGNSKQYRVFLIDPYIEINEKLKYSFRPQQYTQTTHDNYIPLPANSGTVLKEVNIKARNVKGIIANICGDYVCRYDVLNCPNHRDEPDNRPAVKGEVYYINRKQNAYVGCGGISEHGLTGVYDAVDFYPADYEIKSPIGNEYVSTIFWKHQLKISSGADAVVSFYTSDITGKFKIIVQGTAGNDVTYGETSFEVKPDDKKEP